MQQLCALHDHMVASYWHYRVEKQILLRSDWRLILRGKSNTLSSVKECAFYVSEI